VWPDTEALRTQWREGERWRSRMPAGRRAGSRRDWARAVERSFGWVEG
jgi:glycerol kinase